MRIIRSVFTVVLALMLCAALVSCSGAAASPAASQTASPAVATAPAPSPTPAATATAVPATPAPTPSPTAAPTPSPTVKPAPLAYDNPKKYAVTYTVKIVNGGFSPTKVLLYLPVPANQDAQKDVSITAVSPAPGSQAADQKSGNGMLFWQLANTPASGATAAFTLSFTLTAYETVTHIDPASVVPCPADSPEAVSYTKPEKYIESGDSKITALADTIAKGEANPYKLTKAFYDYIIDHTTYRLVNKGLNGALFLLNNGFGECGDYSALFVALCRAKGIPARPVVGYWAISGNDQTHVWAEFFLSGIGWIPVDATIGQQSAQKRTYYFGSMDDQRVILSKGYNTALVPAGPDGFVAPLLQVPLWWFWGSGDSNKLALERDWKVAPVN